MSFRFRTSAKDRAGNRLVAQINRELIRAAIQQKQDSGITRREIASRLGVDRSYITKVLSGKANLTARTVGEFLWALGWEPQFSVRRSAESNSNHMDFVTPPAPAQKLPASGTSSTSSSYSYEPA